MTQSDRNSCHISKKRVYTFFLFFCFHYFCIPFNSISLYLLLSVCLSVCLSLSLSLSLSLYIYIYIYIYICVCVCVCVSVCVNMIVCGLSISITVSFIYIFIYIYKCVYVCLRECVCYFTTTLVGLFQVKYLFSKLYQFRSNRNSLRISHRTLLKQYPDASHCE